MKKRKREKALTMVGSIVNVAANKIKCLLSKPLRQVKILQWLQWCLPVCACLLWRQQRFSMCLCVLENKSSVDLMALEQPTKWTRCPLHTPPSSKPSLWVLAPTGPNWEWGKTRYEWMAVIIIRWTRTENCCTKLLSPFGRDKLPRCRCRHCGAGDVKNWEKIREQ